MNKSSARVGRENLVERKPYWKSLQSLTKVQLSLIVFDENVEIIRIIGAKVKFSLGFKK